MILNIIIHQNPIVKIWWLPVKYIWFIFILYNLLLDILTFPLAWYILVGADFLDNNPTKSVTIYQISKTLYSSYQERYIHVDVCWLLVQVHADKCTPFWWIIIIICVIIRGSIDCNDSTHTLIASGRSIGLDYCCYFDFYRYQLCPWNLS